MQARPPLDPPSLHALLAGDVVDAAAGLIGCRVQHGGDELVIVETEAYHQDEEACHGYGGHTPRAQKLKRPPGHAYVYLSYGIHRLMNVVAGSQEFASGILLRGAVAQPAGGARVDPVPGTAGAIPGPGRIGTALGLGVEHDGVFLLDGGPLQLLPSHPADAISGRELRRGPRIGITKAVELPWRFCLAGSRGVSAPRL